MTLQNVKTRNSKRQQRACYFKPSYLRILSRSDLDHVFDKQSPNLNIKGRMPEELWTGEKKDISYRKCSVVRHCTCAQRIAKEARHKRAGMLMGYCENSKGYRFIDPIKKNIKGHDVIFLKHYREATEGTQNLFGLINDSQEESAKTIKIEDENEISR